MPSKKTHPTWLTSSWGDNCSPMSSCSCPLSESARIPALLLKQAIADIYMVIEKLKQLCVRATPLLRDIDYLDFLVQILNSKVKLVNGEEAQTRHLHSRYFLASLLSFARRASVVAGMAFQVGGEEEEEKERVEPSLALFFGRDIPILYFALYLRRG
jgi:hypothetical protein